MTIYALPLTNKLSGTYTKTVSFTSMQCKANNQYQRKMGVGKDNLQISYELKYIGLTQSEVSVVETLFSIQSLGDVISFRSPIDSFARLYAKPTSWQKENYYGWAKDQPYQKLTDLSFTLVLGNELTPIAKTNLVPTPPALSILLPNTGHLLSTGQSDPNYTCYKISGDSSGVTLAGHAYPDTYWVGDQSGQVTQYITSTSNSAVDCYNQDSYSNGVYKFTLTFDLSGYNLSTINLNAWVSSDNAVSVRLNGVEISTGNFSIVGGAGLNQTTNLLEFYVTNNALSGAGYNPMFLRVEFTTREGSLT